MRAQTWTYLASATIVALSAACGENQTFVDASSGRDASDNRDAASLDAPGSQDGGDIDAATPDGAVADATVADGTVADATVVIDAGAIPDAMPQAAMWRGAQMIENLNGSAMAPVAGMDSSGRAIVVWTNNHRDPEDETEGWGEIRAAHFNPASGWGSPIALSPTPSATNEAEEVALAVNPSGEAMAVWYQIDAAGAVDVYARRFTPAGEWLPATVIHDGTQGVSIYSRPHVALAGDGTAIATWSPRVGTASQLLARRFVPSTGWEPTMVIDAPPGGDAIGMGVGMDGNGRAVAIWTVETTTRTLWGSRFASAGGWSAPVRLDEELAGTNFARIVVDAAGNAVVALAASGENASVWGMIGTADGAWQPATRLEDAAYSAFAFALAGNAAGAAAVAWHSWPQDDSTPAEPSVRVRRFAPSTGWSAVESVETFADESTFPGVAVSPSGAMTVVWKQFASGMNGIWGNRFVPGIGWGTQTRLSTTTTGGYDGATVAAGGVDSVVATWRHEANPIDGHPTPFRVWANVYR